MQIRWDATVAVTIAIVIFLLEVEKYYYFADNFFDWYENGKLCTK